MPERTLQDARDLYLEEGIGEGDTKTQEAARRRFTRVLKLADDAGLSLTTPLVDLTRAHARKVRDHMLALPKADGSKRDPRSVRRDMTSLKAAITRALRECDRKLRVKNPFDRLEVWGSTAQTAVVAARETRSPLPPDVVSAMRAKLTGALLLIWRIPDGTGCRLGELQGLRLDDVVLTGLVPHPHLRLRPNEWRRLKNAASCRKVPFIGDALEAAKEAVASAGGGSGLFRRYARKGGPSAASAILMKHLHSFTTDRRHTVHSLRHAVEDNLDLAGVLPGHGDLVLGYVKPSAKASYGVSSVRLELACRALVWVAEWRTVDAPKPPSGSLLAAPPAPLP